MVKAINKAIDKNSSTQWAIAGTVAKKSKAGIIGNSLSAPQSFQLIILAANQKIQVTESKIFASPLLAGTDFLLSFNQIKTFPQF